MRIKTIEISNYKSIKKPQSLDLSSSMISLIGKNGSGKTNILDALFLTFENRRLNHIDNLDYKFFLELEDSDLESFKDVLDISEDDRTIEAYQTGEQRISINIDRIKSKAIMDLLDNTKGSIFELARQVKEALEQFNETIEEMIDTDPLKEPFTIDVDWTSEDIRNSSNYGYLFERMHDEINQSIERVNKILSERLNDDELAIDYHYLGMPEIYKKHWDFELRYARPKLTKFEAKHITVNEEAIKREIDHVNQRSLELRKRIDELYAELETRLKHFHELIDNYYDAQATQEDHYQSIMRKIVTTCNPKVYYLRNENNQLFFTNNNYRDMFYMAADERTILETFITYHYSPQDATEFQKRYKEKKLSKQELSEVAGKLEEQMNDNLPPYDRDMIESIRVNDDLSFSIIEKTGDEVSFSDSNAGRRWFFTYFFIKGCLQPGDVLIMDEPASNLHPEAQIHIRKEIEDISHDNLVIMTTHSPYMISSKSLVYYLEITDDGTMLSLRQNKEIREILSELNVFGADTVIGDVLLNNRLLSFEQIGKRIKDALKKNHITQKEASLKLGIDERSMRRKLNGKYLTYENVKWFCETYDFNPLDLIVSNRIG
jgi:predicted ATP-dependent endonuclease of OLD family